MSIFAKATQAPEPRTKDVTPITMLLAILFVAMALTQLFTFEDFLQLLVSFNLPFGAQGAYFIGSFVVVAEVFSLPFLLRMPLSKAFRWVSMAFSWFATLVWIKIAAWVVLTQPGAENVGFLGTLVGLTPGWWAILVAIALAILASWATWGLWPGKRKNKVVE